MAYVIATTNMKGGVGKTTLCVNLATSLAQGGKRVLVVDLDTQISATLSLMSPQDFVKCRKERRTLRQLISQKVDPSSAQLHATAAVIRPYMCGQKGLSLLPGDLDLYDDYMVSSFLHEQALQGKVPQAKASEGTAQAGKMHEQPEDQPENQPENQPERSVETEADSTDFKSAWGNFERTLVKGILQPVQNDYDFIILDCAPGYNLLTRSSFVASNFYILPAKPEPLSIAGIQLLQRRIDRLRQNYEEAEPMDIELLGIVFTMSGNLFTSRYYNQVMRRVQQDYSEHQIFKTQIPNDIQVSRAVDTFKPVVLANPGAAGAKAFAKLTAEFLQKLELLTGTKEQTSRMSLAQME